MRLLAAATAVLAGAAAASSAAAPERVVGKPENLVAAHGRITQFAQDGAWVAWITAQKGCGRRLHLLSLRTRKRVTVEHVGSPVGCDDEALALAGSRAAWLTLVGAGNTELDYAVETATATDRKPRRVRLMVILRDSSGSEPHEPPIAGHGTVLAYYRHEDGLESPEIHAVERVVGRRPKRVFRDEDPVALAVGGGRIAAVHQRLVRGDACNCNFDPAWSPDGKQIAFISGDVCCVEDEAHSDVYVMSADGGGRRQVTTDQRAKLGVAWSPDGARLAFGYYDDRFVARIAIINANGTGRHDVAVGRDPSWSRDGAQLAFARRSELYIANSDGTNVRRLVGGSTPAWSPDGTRIAYENVHLALATIKADGTDNRVLGGGLQEPAWSPDGLRLAAAGPNGIAIVDASGGRSNVKGTMRGDAHPSWSSNGTTIAFDSVRNDLVPDIYARPELYVTDPNGHRTRPLTYTKPDEWGSPLEIRSLKGRLISAAAAPGAPLGAALSGRYAAVLTRAAHTGAKTIALFDATTGDLRTLLSVHPNAVGTIAASSGHLIYFTPRSIRWVDFRTESGGVVVHTKGTILGASIFGRRVVWAENARRRGVIRSAPLPLP
jgi:WD40 repeat protein